VASLVERFGERVLGAPKNRGFARAAWLGPIVIVLVGLGMIAVYLRRYLARPVEKAPAPAPNPALRERIERELESRQG